MHQQSNEAQSTRRELLGKSIGFAAAVASVPSLVTGFESNPVPPEPSAVVTDFVFSQYQRAWAHRSDPDPNPDLLYSVADATDLLFGHYQEIGFNQELERQLREDANAAINYSPTPIDMAATLTILEEHGIEILPAEYMAIFPAPETRAASAQLVLGQGILATAANLTALIRNKAQQMAGQKPSPLPDSWGLCAGLTIIMGLLALGCIFGGIGFCVAGALLLMAYGVLMAFDIC